MMAPISTYTPTTISTAVSIETVGNPSSPMVIGVLEQGQYSISETIVLNAETTEAMMDAIRGTNLSSFNSVDEYFKSFE